MEKTVLVGENEIRLKSSAATNILYKKAFHEDILVKLTEYTKNLKELKSMQAALKEIKENASSDEEALAKLSEITNSDAFVSTTKFSEETLPKLAYIMYLEANEKIGTIFSKLNDDDFLAWLMTIDQDELLKITGEVMDIWQAGTKTHSKPKN